MRDLGEGVTAVVVLKASNSPFDGREIIGEFQKRLAKFGRCQSKSSPFRSFPAMPWARCRRACCARPTPTSTD